MVYYEIDQHGEKIKFNAPSIFSTINGAIAGTISFKHSENIVERIARVSLYVLRGISKRSTSTLVSEQQACGGGAHGRTSSMASDILCRGVFGSSVIVVETCHELGVSASGRHEPQSTSRLSSPSVL